MTGQGTTHDTNSTLFQLPNDTECDISTLSRQENLSLDIRNNAHDLPQEESAKGQRIGQPLFPSYVDVVETSELYACFKRDVVWALVGSLASTWNNEDLPPVGSSTAFNKLVSEYMTSKCVQEYLPVTPEPQTYPVCKEYLDFLLDLLDYLEIPHIFIHSDEAVYSKLCHILWKTQELYKQLIFLMGSFHQLRVRQKLIFKRYQCRRLQEWCRCRNYC